MFRPRYWKNNSNKIISCILDIRNLLRNFARMRLQNKTKRRKEKMKCMDGVNITQAEWRGSMKIYFHGFGGLGNYPNKQKMHFVCTNALLAN